jgi:hypothetical protein
LLGLFEAFYFESGYRERSFHALYIENYDSISDSLDFLSLEMDQNYPKASIAIIAIKRFSLLYNLDIKQIDLNLTYVKKRFISSITLLIK